MKYLPYERFYIDTQLKPNEVQKAMEKEISPRSNRFLDFGRSTGGTYFKGYVMNGEFQFEPDISGRNSFNPQIKGSISAYENGSRVIVKMTLNPAVWIFISFALFFLAIAGLSIVISEIMNAQIGFRFFAPLLMFASIYLVATLCYKSESIPAKDKLTGLLEGKIIYLK
jgi:hypothetical protein